MKHLTYFNESFNSNLQDLKDICLELTDDRYVVSFNHPENTIIQIFISKRGTQGGSFSIDSVYDTIKRIQDFSKDKYDIQIGGSMSQLMGDSYGIVNSGRFHFNLGFNSRTHKSPYDINSVEKLIDVLEQRGIKTDDNMSINQLVLILIPKNYSPLKRFEGLTNQYESNAKEVYLTLKEIIIELQHEGFTVYVGDPDWKQDTLDGFQKAYSTGFAYDIRIYKLSKHPEGYDVEYQDDDAAETFDFMRTFKLHEVYETLLRIQDYLKSMGHYVSLHARKVGTFGRSNPMNNCDKLGGYFNKNSNIVEAKVNISFNPQYESRINESYNRQDLEEIFYDLTDDKGFEVEFNDNIRLIIITKPNMKTFILDDGVMEVLLRAIEYLGNDLMRISLKELILANFLDNHWTRYYRDKTDVPVGEKPSSKDLTISDLPCNVSVNVINLMLKK